MAMAPTMPSALIFSSFDAPTTSSSGSLSVFIFYLLFTPHSDVSLLELSQVVRPSEEASATTRTASARTGRSRLSLWHSTYIYIYHDFHVLNCTHSYSRALISQFLAIFFHRQLYQYTTHSIAQNLNHFYVRAQSPASSAHCSCLYNIM